MQGSLPEAPLRSKENVSGQEMQSQEGSPWREPCLKPSGKPRKINQGIFCLGVGCLVVWFALATLDSGFGLVLFSLINDIIRTWIWEMF